VGVLIASRVAGVEDVAASMRPTVVNDPPLGILSDGLGGIRIVRRTHPDVEHSVHGSDVAELAAIGADLHQGALWIAEERVTGDEVGLSRGAERKSCKHDHRQ